MLIHKSINNEMAEKSMLAMTITFARQTEGIVKLMPGDDNGVVNVLDSS